MRTMNVFKVCLHSWSVFLQHILWLLPFREISIGYMMHSNMRFEPPVRHVLIYHDILALNMSTEARTLRNCTHFTNSFWLLVVVMSLGGKYDVKVDALKAEANCDCCRLTIRYSRSVFRRVIATKWQGSLALSERKRMFRPCESNSRDASTHILRTTARKTKLCVRTAYTQWIFLLLGI